MTGIVLTSASGAPGVTTTALGLVLTWPGPVVLVDADRAASQAVAAGYLQGRTPPGGVQAVLQAHRERRSLASALSAHATPLPLPPLAEGEPAPRRDFVAGFTHLGSIELFESVWSPLWDEVRGAGTDVVVDAGRPGHRGLPPGLVSGADLVAVVCRTSLVSLAGIRLHLAPLVEVGPPGRVGLVLIGPGRPYGAREIAEQFGVPVLAEVVWDPSGAAELSEGVPTSRTWSRQRLARSWARAAHALRTAARPLEPAEVGA